MGGHFKSRGRHLLEIAWAFMDVKNFGTVVALEVMMVPKVCQLVAGRGTGDLYHSQESVFQKVFQVSVDGRDPDSRDIL